MSQNRSHAVMAQRAEPHDSLDFFPTPPWATRALCEHVIGLRGYVALDPACGNGAMVRALSEYALAVGASDVHDYGWGHVVHDFLMPYKPPGLGTTDWVITNPPFRLAEQFVERGLELAEHGVALLVRSVFVEGVGRYERLYRDRPPAVIAQFTERVPMVKGRLDPKASTATSYAWIVWAKEPVKETRLAWIPPCRKRLERAGDYDNLAVAQRDRRADESETRGTAAYDESGLIIAIEAVR